MSEGRVLFCRFNSDNELHLHSWQVHEQLDENQINGDDRKVRLKTCLDQPVWECITGSEHVFRILDFTDLFNEIRQICPGGWRFHKGLIPYVPIRFTFDAPYPPSLSRSLQCIEFDQLQNYDYYMIVDIANRNVRFELITISSQAGAMATLESCYHAFVTRLEQWFLQSQLTKFMASQERLSNQLSIDIHNVIHRTLHM